MDPATAGSCPESDPPTTTPSSSPLPRVVALGASAGGLESLEQFFDALDDGLGCSFVVLQHLSPEYKSLMAELLARHTKLSVARAADGMRLQPNHVYLNEAARNLVLEGDRFRSVERNTKTHPNLPIDLFFESLARHHGASSLAIILSGTGSDGMRGLRRLKEAGGVVFAQDSASARFDGMPRAAISTGLVDAIVRPEEMPALIRRWVKDSRCFDPRLDSTDEDKIVTILELVARDGGVQFDEYKRGTILRRIQRRIVATATGDLEGYLSLLRQSPSELDILRRDLLINVTRFFRDPEVFSALAERVLPKLFESLPPGEALRVWVPGCSSGDEAYTIGMLLLEAREALGLETEIRILATDVDPHSLETANAGRYPQHIEYYVSEERLARFFERGDDTYTVRSELRQLILFAQHNVVSDPPFTRISLVSCRNLLIYLDTRSQQRVLQSFRFALRRDGVLLLGKSESVGDLSRYFPPIDVPSRIYASTGERPTAIDHESHDVSPRALESRLMSRQPQARAVEDATQVLVTNYSPAAIVVTESYRLVHVFGDISPFLKLRTGDVNLSVLSLTSRPLASLISAAVPRAIKIGRESTYSGSGIPESLDLSDLELRVTPLRNPIESQRAVLIAFERSTPLAPNRGDTIEVDVGTEQTIQRLQQELRHSRENLQAMVEELETSNEELQSTNEELTSANEELQSTNEELQAVNEELHTLNAEYVHKIADLAVLSEDIENILRGTEFGTLLLDEDLHIRKFTPATIRYLPVLDHDVGRPLEHLALPVDKGCLIERARDVLHGGPTYEERTRFSDGRHVLTRVTPYICGQQAPKGVILSFVDVSLLELANVRTQRVLDSLPQGVALLRADGTILMVNESWRRFARENGNPPETTIGVGANYFAATANASTVGDEGATAALEGLKAVADRRIPSFSLEYPCHSVEAQRWFLLDASRIDGTNEIVVAHTDITERKLVELSVRNLAMIDPLTGALNRRGLTDCLRDECTRARRSGSHVAAVVIDCDDFKRINEAHGYAVGDAVLCAIVRRIEAELRPYDRIARVGGDEFVVLLPDARIAEAMRVAERLRVAVSRQPILRSETPVPVTLSLAVTSIDTEDPQLDPILVAAESALKQCKQQGKDRVRVALIDGNHTFEDERGILSVITTGRGLRVVAQPIFDLASNQPVATELLIRAPQGVALTPPDLFRMASEESRLNDFDLACLRTALAASQSLALPRHVNLYPSTLLSRSIDELVELIRSVGGSELCIELSEQELLGAPAALRDATSLLRHHGIRIAIDDVGFGLTSLEHLVLLEPDVVKIDRRWVSGVGADKGRQRTLERLFGVCRALDCEVVAEGVETSEDLGVVTGIGITRAQGFFWGQPQRVEPPTRRD